MVTMTSERNDLKYRQQTKIQGIILCGRVRSSLVSKNKYSKYNKEVMKGSIKICIRKVMKLYQLIS